MTPHRNNQDVCVRVRIMRIAFYPMGGSPTPNLDYEPDFVIPLGHPLQIVLAVPYDPRYSKSGPLTEMQNRHIYYKINEVLSLPRWARLWLNLTDSGLTSTNTLEFEYSHIAEEVHPGSVEKCAQAIYDALLKLEAPQVVGKPIDNRKMKREAQARYDVAKSGNLPSFEDDGAEEQ